MHSQYSSCSKFREHENAQFKAVQLSTSCESPHWQEPAAEPQSFKLGVPTLITHCHSLKKKAEEEGYATWLLTWLTLAKRQAPWTGACPMAWARLLWQPSLWIQEIFVLYFSTFQSKIGVHHCYLWSLICLSWPVPHTVCLTTTCHVTAGQ